MTEATVQLSKEEKKAKAKASFAAFFERSSLVMFKLVDWPDLGSNLDRASGCQFDPCWPA
jgi:hypothetical protein